MKLIVHRCHPNGFYPKCGADGGNISMSGVMITCPKCIEIDRPPSREEQMARLVEAAERFRARR